MRKLKEFIKILSPEFVICIALFIAAFSLLLSGSRLFCLEQQDIYHTQPQHTKETPAQIQENVAKNIIRLHVIANSDSDTDQKLKLMVRDNIITSLQDALQQADTITDAKKILLAQQAQIEKNACQTLAGADSSYSVKVSLEPRYFPVKQYGDLSFPAGTYQALCVEIGKAEGRNWWCVLFPSLCFVNETTATVPEASKDRLKECLSDEEYDYLSEDTAEEKNTSKPELHFGLMDWLKNNGE